MIFHYMISTIIKLIYLTLRSNNEKILVTEYIFFGIYDINTKFWIWSSSISGVNKLQISFVNEIKKKSILLKNLNLKDTYYKNYIDFIYQLLTNEILFINNISWFYFFSYLIY